MVEGMSKDNVCKTRRNVLRTVGGSALALTAVGVASADHMHPEVTTISATDQTQSSAFLHGEVEEFGEGADSAEAWFDFRELGSSTWLSTSEVTLDDPDYYSGAAMGLTSDTWYEFRAVAEDNDGDRGYGDILTFKTLSDDEQIQ